MNKKIIFIAGSGVLMLMTAFSFLLYSHGIQLNIVKKYPCIVANAKYHGSRGLTDADVIIRFENENKKFQTGKTDKNGNFCFFPDQTGKWSISIDDGMGHRSKGEVIIDNAFFEVLPKQTETAAEVKTPDNSKPLPQSQNFKEKSDLTQKDSCCYFLKIILGVLLILIITFILYRWKKLRNNKKK